MVLQQHRWSRSLRQMSRATKRLPRCGHVELLAELVPCLFWELKLYRTVFQQLTSWLCKRRASIRGQIRRMWILEDDRISRARPNLYAMHVVRTVTDERLSKRFFFHDSQVHGCSVSDFVIHIVQAPTPCESAEWKQTAVFSGFSPCQEDLDATLHIAIPNIHTKFGQSRDSCCSNNSVLENDSVVDVTDVF